MIYERLPVGRGYSTRYPSIDFETYSEAGFIWLPEINKWQSIAGKGKKGGLPVVGAPVYTEHPSCEVISLAYNLRDGRGPQLWVQGDPPPQRLFDHIARGGILQAWNSLFEYYVWLNVCTSRMGWPPLPLEQLSDAMPKARTMGLPATLAGAGAALNAPIQKLADGTRLLNKFSKPRNPTRGNPSRRLLITDDLIDGSKLLHYNLVDIESEAAISDICPDLSPEEHEIWALDQRINTRGVAVDMPLVNRCIEIVERVIAEGSAELQELTGGAVGSVGELDKLSTWLHCQGVRLDSLESDNVSAALDRTDLPPAARRALEIRASLSLSSVKKLYAIRNRVSRDGRLRDLFAYYGAERTGRFAGRGSQPQNLPGGEKHEEVERILTAIASGVPLEGDLIALVSSCLRGLFVAGPGCDLLCSDYSAIEAVVAAMVAGEQWRIDVFRTHGKIYEMSASRITGVPFQDFVDYKERTGNHHPLRKTVGKIAELASGYQGSVGAWKKFGAAEHIGSDEKILEAVRAWRAQSPAIVHMWYGLEDTARQAIQCPGQCVSYRGISYGVKDNVLYCQLPSGRCLTYQQPRLVRDVTPWGREVWKITYMGKESGTGIWTRLDTYGGKLFENIVQAISRDILCHAMVRLEAAGYLIVLHVHDEIVAEVPEGRGSIEEFEHIMGQLPAWAEDWPIRAAGGWRGKRYRKD